MLLELLRPLSFMAGMLSLYPVLLSAFFVPGTHWAERLETALLRAALAGCVCALSGVLFALPDAPGPDAPGPAAREPLMATLPVRVFLFAVAGMAILFLLTWWLDTYYMPLLQHGCCRP